MWNKRHRALLVLLGWLRYLREKGADLNWVRTELGMEDLTDVVKRIEDPKALHAELQRIESKLTRPRPYKVERAYSQFKELPSAHALYPT